MPIAAVPVEEVPSCHLHPEGNFLTKTSASFHLQHGSLIQGREKVLIQIRTTVRPKVKQCPPTMHANRGGTEVEDNSKR